MITQQSLIKRSTLQPVGRLELINALLAEVGPAGLTLHLGNCIFNISGADWSYILNAAQAKLSLEAPQ